MHILKNKVALFVCIVMCMNISCRNKGGYGWSIGRIRTKPGTQYFVPYHPSVQEIRLGPGMIKTSVNMIGTLALDKDTANASVIFKALTELNDASRVRQPSSYWYVFKVFNMSNHEKWAIEINNHALDPVLFEVLSGDSLVKLERSAKPWEVNPIITEYIFGVSIPHYARTTLLLKVDNEYLPFVNEVTIYPYHKSIYTPIDDTLFEGLLTGLIYLIVILLLYSFFLTWQPIYIVYAVYFLYVVYILQTWTNISVLKSERINPFYTFQLAPLFGFFVLLLIPYLKIKFSIPFNVLLCLILLEPLASNANILFHIYLGAHYIEVLDGLILLVFIWHAFDREMLRYRFRFYKYLIGLYTIVQIIYFCQKIDWMPFLYGSPWCILVLTILELTMLFMRYITYRMETRKREVQQAIDAEKELAQRVINVLEEERKRISQDLHDEVGGSLAVLKIKAQHISIDKEQLSPLLNVLDQAADATRTISHRLMPPYFESTDMLQLLEAQLQNSDKKGQIRLFLDVVGKRYLFSKQDELMIYRIIMELVHNCLKHSFANSINVQLHYNGSELRIMCEDDGVGFSPEIQNGIGLQSISARVSFIGGRLNIDSGSAGTTVVIVIPYKRNNP
ncbi:MAG: sensor histidine kinase [Bacteroidetes bacterium]|nr:sensor histidine kinase [Bacteroidota bacterium]